MGTLTPIKAAPQHITEKLHTFRVENKTLREMVDQLNRFVDAVANISPDVAERAALAVD